MICYLPNITVEFAECDLALFIFQPFDLLAVGSVIDHPCLLLLYWHPAGSRIPLTCHWVSSDLQWFHCQ